MRLNGEMSYSLTGRPDAMGRVVMSQQNVNGDWCVAHLDEANRGLQDLQDPDRYKRLTYRPLYEDGGWIRPGDGNVYYNEDCLTPRGRRGGAWR